MKTRDRKPAAPASAPAGGVRDTGFLLQRAHRRLRAALTDALVPYNLGVGHLGVLGLLHTRGDLSQQQLIGILEIDKSTMVNLVDELERQGLAERRPAPGDRRAYAVRLTSVGRERLAVIGEAVTRVQDALLSPLSSAERDRLNALLWKIAG